MIKQVLHPTTAPVAPARVCLALAVAHELHTPAAPAPEAYELRTVVTTATPASKAYELRAPARRAPEVAVPQLMGLRRTNVGRPRRKVPLNRLTTAMC
ncbi:hypothetical protein ACWEO4_33510 [Streptomyces sp. NPDC004393]|uniref:hypothetical protein n=1 Tax=Streptomyces sp. NPDC004533 TaxID=3154278 RepID=UPI0033AF1222